MDKGVSYTYSVSAFPRVKYFQERLLRITPRWKRILDGESLQECISQGTLREKEILSLVDDTRDKVTINVFEEGLVIDPVSPVLHVQRNLNLAGDIQKTKISWLHFIQSEQKKCGHVVTVIMVPSLDVKGTKKLETQLSGVSDELLQNMIIYDKDTDTNYTYRDLMKVNFNVKDLIPAVSGNVGHIKSLSKQIQFMLEMKIVKVLEMISDYNTLLLPRKQEETVEELHNVVQLKLVKSLSDEFVVKDLSPERRSGEADMKPSDMDLSKLAAAVGKGWENLALPLGIQEAEINEIKKSNQSTQSMILNMFYLWRQRDDSARLDFLLQLLENKSLIITSIDRSVVKAMKVELQASLSSSAKDVIFHRKLLEFVAKKTKCDICDTLSQKYGLSANFVNEFFNDGFYGYETKVMAMMNTMSLPSWPRDESGSAVSTCKAFAHHCGYNLTGIIKETEDYIKAKREYLTVVKKLQFELEGLLEQTEVSIETHIPDLPKMSNELQDELLSIPEVYGCGIMWGELTLHVTDVLSANIKQDVKDLLLKHRYTYNYSTQLIQPPKAAAGTGHIKQGSSIRVEKKEIEADGEKYEFGTFGCLVNVKPKNGRSVGDGTFHCITCAHCVNNCKNGIYVYSDKAKDYELLGGTKYQEYYPDAIDIALIEIRESNIKHCCKSLQEPPKKSPQESSITESPIEHKWSFYNGPTSRRIVFKFGSRTHLTCGICMCDDYKTRETLLNYNQNSQRNFDINVNILIEPEPDKPGAPVSVTASDSQERQREEAVQKFSEHGDSGAVIFDDDKNGDIEVLALLYGSITDKDNKYLYSYASHIMRLKEFLENKHKIEIEPALSSEDGMPGTEQVLYNRQNEAE